ncbi:unnamed protein product, partial [Rotaria sp. Silwood1]
QNFFVCPTAVWSSTVRIIAGATSLYSSAANRLYNPMDVAYDANGTLYVADSTNDRIQRFVNGSTTGTSLSGLTINNPTAVFMTNNGILYIIDSLNYRVLRWNNGVATIVAGGHGIGSTLDKMSTSNGLYIDTNLNIYISDTANNRVTFWTAGNTTIGRLMAGGNSAGSGAHQLNSPWGIYVDANGTLYIVDSSNHRVQKWLPGKYLYRLSSF